MSHTKNRIATRPAAGRAAALVVTALGTLLLGAAPASASHFDLFGSYWDTDEAGGAGGGGLAFGIPVGRRWSIDLRGSYYEELANEPLEALFDDGDPVFDRNGLEVLPLEAGLRVDFAPDARVSPYLGGGASYFLLDSDLGDVDDEVGAYLLLGATFGRPSGVSFFVEGIWRIAEATVELDPEDLEDIDDIDLDGRVPVDLNGLGVNAGVTWRFGGGR
jgi:hypothetical protein